jgi:hypothetical protein
MDWDEILEQFYQEFDRKVRAGSVSALSSTEALMLSWYTKWLEEHYNPPTVLS